MSNLQNLASHLAVEGNVEFRTNLGFEELKREMGDGIVGLHTMWNEHFGIGELPGERQEDKKGSLC